MVTGLSPARGLLMVPEMVLSRWFSCWFSIAVATAPPERSGFSPAAGAIWAPASANASYVFLRTARPIALPAQLVSARIVVSSLPDFGTDDGNQRLLAAYRLFANGVEVGIGPGRGRKPTHPAYWMDVGADSIVLDASMLAGGTLSLALQCFQAAPSAPTNGWAMLELTTYDAAGQILSTHATAAGTSQHAAAAPTTWMAYSANAIFGIHQAHGSPEWNDGVKDTCGRINENQEAGELAKVEGWREASYTPSARAGWVPAEGRMPTSPPLPKITLPLQVAHGQAPVQVLALSEVRRPLR
jgi:hypothetical protein